MSVVINGSAGVTTNSGAVYNGIASGTAVASTSGTSIDFTSIPSWVKRITVMFNGVSTNGTSLLQVQLGDAGGVETTSYLSGGWTNNTVTATSTTGLMIAASSSTGAAWIGAMTIYLTGSNTWVSTSTVSISAGGGSFATGSKALSDTLTQVRITTVNGTDTFDAGSINILYE